MQDVKEKKIGEHTYRVRYLPPSKVLKIFSSLFKMLAPAFGKLVDGSLKDGANVSDVLNREIKNISIGAAVEALVERWDDANVEALIRDLAIYSEVSTDGQRWPSVKDVYEVHFTGRPKELFEWVYFALEMQFKDFFPASGGSVLEKGLSLLNSGPMSASPSMSKSDGSYGG